MKPDIGLPVKDREGVADILHALLSDEFVLYAKTLNYHWNVTGPHFDELHKFFGTQYGALQLIMDDVAERARMLGGKAPGTLKEFLQHARIKEQPGKEPDAWDMIANLLSDHEAIVRSLRVDLETSQSKYHDAGTTDFLTGLMEQHEKMAWMLRAFIEGKSCVMKKR